MDDKKQDKWYFKTSLLIMAFLCVGPFALPLFWANPRYGKINKIITSILVIVVTYFLAVITYKSFKTIINAYQITF